LPALGTGMAAIEAAAHTPPPATASAGALPSLALALDRIAAPALFLRYTAGAALGGVAVAAHRSPKA